MVEIEGFALQAAILHECQNYLGGGGGLGGSAPLPLQVNRPLGKFEKLDDLTIS